MAEKTSSMEGCLMRAMELDSNLPPGMAHKLGDNTELNIVKYAEARAKEMDAMDSASTKAVRNKKAMQSVPIHMRRRAASHNVKRLPRRLRDKAINEMKEAQPKKSKRPSRKHRRRPSNLLQEYNRRKKAFMWLETHIWHAKRFHMQKQWGYNVAMFPNDKSLRACYRASVRHCLMWDMSYLACLEINGSQTDILDGLQKITSPLTGGWIGCVAYLSGSIEGTTFLYECDQYPRGAIGPVMFQWKPTGPHTEISTSGSRRTLWLWLHPITFSSVLKELQTVFNAVLVSGKTPLALVNPSKKDILTRGQSHTNKKAAAAKNVMSKDDGLRQKHPDIDAPIYRGFNVEIVSLKDTLCRFRLMGPESQAILTDVLQTAEVSCESNDGCETRQQEQPQRQGGAGCWWERFFSGASATDVHVQQCRAWREITQLSSSIYLPPHTVLGLTVGDPRLRLPDKRTKVTNSEDKLPQKPSESSEDNRQSFSWPEVSYSPLWDADVRKNVKETMLSEQQINAKRAQNLIPGQPLDLGVEESRIPLLLIQRPGTVLDSEPQQHHWQFGEEAYGAGWDIILPGGWAMAFWIALVYRGARVGGIRELVSTDFELGEMHFPDFNPDTLAGKMVAKARRKELSENNEKKPPAKRPNYQKLGVPAPFHCPWEHLNGNQNASSDLKSEEKEEKALDETGLKCELFVLRHGSQLQGLHTLFRSLPRATADLSSPVIKPIWNAFSAGCKESQDCLVAVQLTMVGRGTCKPFSLIHYPSESDLHQLATDSHYEGPTEKIHKPAKSGLIATNVEAVMKKEDLRSSDLIHPGREVCGYVCEGGFSLHHGKGAGLGYLTRHTLYRLMNMDLNRKPLVLVRCPTSLQYRFSHVSVLPLSNLVQL